MHPVPASKSALKAILEARGAWANVDIRDGQPTEKEDVTRDMFWFNDTEVPEDDWSSIGGAGRRITFRLGFSIAVIRNGDDERTTEDVMWTLYEDLMAALKANSTLTGTVQMVQEINGRQSNDPMPKAWSAVFVGSIGCFSKAY